MNLDHLVDKLPTHPVGVEKTAEVGPDAFDSFKDTQGRFRTQSLFWETRHESYPAYFTTKRQPIERDGQTYISLYEKYMEIADPTEYQVAIRLLGSWDHWKALLSAQWFQELVSEWRTELRIKMESDRYFKMKEVSEDATKGRENAAVQATKWLADRYTPGDRKAKRGRPTKEEKKAHLKAVETEASELKEDAKRLGLVKA